MRYIIKHIEKTSEPQVVLFIAHAAEIASTPEQAAEQFLAKHPDRVVHEIHEADETDRQFLGLGYLTEEERADYESRVHAMYEKSGRELDEIKERLLEYEPEEFLANVEYQNRREAEETQNAEGVHLGDIFYSSWGYDQTNIDFYQVVELKGKHTLVLRRNKAKKGLSQTSWNGYTRPIRDEFETGYYGEPITVRTKFVDYRGNGEKKLHVRADEHLLDYVEFGKLYDYSTGA